MTKIVGIVGSGMVGRDPWDPKCWSRSGFNLFTNLKKAGVLERAIGVEVPMILRAPVMLKNVAFNKRRWRQKFNLDPFYYEMLTQQIKRAHTEKHFGSDCVTLQVGGHYNAHKATGLRAYSYHDGNIHGLMNSPYFSKDLLPYAQRAFEFEKRTYQDMTKIFVMSEYWRHSFITHFGVAAEKVVNVGFGVNIDVPAAPIKDVNSKNIVFIGIDFERKGGDALVKAFRQLKELNKHADAKLHIIGPRQLPATLADTTDSDGIVFHGHLSREIPEEKQRLEKVLAEGNLLVIPSLYEPFGNVALEAMLYRMPVIATNDWSFPDFVIPNKTGSLLNNKGDSNEIAEHIIRFLESPQERIDFGIQGYQLVTEKYTWNNTISNIIAAIG
jgi:alpha-maltose-1-phosphate synthase